MHNKFNINDEVTLVFITKIIICKINSIYIKDNTIWYKLVANDFEYDASENEILKYNKVKNNKFESKFCNGDKIWIIERSDYIYEDCDMCENTGSIEFKGHKFVCPQCHGERKKINKVNWKVNKNPKKIERTNIINLEHNLVKILYSYLSDDKSYIIDKNENDCFESLEKAQEECNKRNK